MWKRVPVLILGLVCSTAAAEIYRWVDDRGRVHFGDRPSGDGAETVDLRPEPGAAADAVTPPAAAGDDRLQRWLKAKEGERVDRRRTAQKEREQRKRRSNDCKQARSAWDYYQRGGVFYDDRPDGTRHFLDDAEMAEERNRVRREVRRLCGKDPLAGARPKEER